jgi:uncharacterized protein involved in outer membrane biogenesis
MSTAQRRPMRSKLTGLFPRGVTTGRLDIQAPMERWSDLFKRASGELAVNITGGKLDGIGFKTFGSGSESRTFFRLKDTRQGGRGLR